MRAILSGRSGAPGAAQGLAGELADGGAAARRLRDALLARSPSRLALRLAALVALAAVAVVLAGRLGGGGGVVAQGRSARAAAVTFEGVAYSLLGVTVPTRIPQRGDAALRASGRFVIVKLRLRSADALRHVVVSDLVTLDARGTYYGVSSPETIGLTDRQWGALGAATVVPARRSVTVKAVFDVPSDAAAHRLALHIGQFDFVGQPPARTLPLTIAGSQRGASARGPRPTQRTAAAAREHAELLTISPSPLLG